MELTVQERRLSRLLLALAILYGLASLAHVVVPVTVEPAREFLAEHLFLVVGSAVKWVALALLAFNAFISVRHHDGMIRILLWVHGLAAVLSGAFASFATLSPARWILVGSGAVDGALLLLLLAFYLRAIRSRGDTEVFNEVQRDTFAQLVDAIIPPPAERAATPEELTKRFEVFLEGLDSTAKDLLRTALDVLAPLLRLVGLESDTRSARESLRARLRDALQSDDEIMQNPARLLHILITYLYYSHPSVDSQLGYVRFRQRSRPEANEEARANRFRVRHSLPRRDYDVCIVGSGVAGSVLANRLASKGKSVLLLEAGDYYPEDQITDDEFLMLGHLYKTDVFAGALGGSLSVIQARCVGGGAVINNAVCFRMPEFVEREWQNFGADLDSARLRRAFDTIGTELGIRPSDQVVRKASDGRPYLNPSRDRFRAGVEKLGIPNGTGDPALIKAGFHTVPVNLRDCLGCGYCDIGCTYGRKTNTLQVLLPKAVETGNCDVVARAQVEEVLAEPVAPGARRAAGLRVRLKDGTYRVATARIYILSAGAIASSEILLRSELSSALALPIGKRFSANAATLLHARYGDDVLNAYDGLQVSDYFLEKNADGTWDWIGEIWFNPPGAHSQAMPGYLDRHFERMKAYPHYATVATLVGSEPDGEVVLNLWTRRARLRFRLSPSDLAKLKRGMRRCAEVFFAGGATEVLAITRGEMVLRGPDELDRIEREIREPEDILGLATGHPMGGNCMSDARLNGDPRGVVGSDFRVHGTENLYICDASVFPTSVKVNPQWTIMALAELCADELLNRL